MLHKESEKSFLHHQQFCNSVLILPTGPSWEWRESMLPHGFHSVQLTAHSTPQMSICWSEMKTKERDSTQILPEPSLSHIKGPLRCYHLFPETFSDLCQEPCSVPTFFTCEAAEAGGICPGGPPNCCSSSGSILLPLPCVHTPLANYLLQRDFIIALYLISKIHFKK
jgi:hypothetical protein